MLPAIFSCVPATEPPEMLLAIAPPLPSRALLEVNCAPCPIETFPSVLNIAPPLHAASFEVNCASSPTVTAALLADSSESKLYIAPPDPASALFPLNIASLSIDICASLE